MRHSGTKGSHRSNSKRPLFAFADIWTELKGRHGDQVEPIPGPHLVYGLLTTAPNAIVEPIHPKAMPVILTTDAGDPDHRRRARRLARTKAIAVEPTKARRSRRRVFELGERPYGFDLLDGHLCAKSKAVTVSTRWRLFREDAS